MEKSKRIEKLNKIEVELKEFVENVINNKNQYENSHLYFEFVNEDFSIVKYTITFTRNHVEFYNKLLKKICEMGGIVFKTDLTNYKTTVIFM